MDFASSKAYISKRKIQKAAPKAEGELSEIQEKCDSDNSLSDAELDQFDGKESKPMEDVEEMKHDKKASCEEKPRGGGLFGAIKSVFSGSKPEAKPEAKPNAIPLVPLAKLPGHQAKRHRQEVDTNIIGFKLSVLKDKTEIATGDAIVCDKCKAMFNIYSILTKEQVWVCEFCNHPNKVVIEEEEMPKSDSLTYVLESAQQSMMKKGGGEDITVMFCIDVSGSMCVTQPVQGAMNLKYNKVKKMQDLMKFSDGSYQYMSGESASLAYISRMQCVQTAIESQLKELAFGAPKRKVGIVTFSNEVTLLGDGRLPPKTFAGDKLNDYEGLIETAQKDAEIYMTKSIEETKDDLIKRLEQIEESGQTALGPGLTVALGIALKGNPGSRVILCTDGLANVGLGSVENLKNAKEVETIKSFYTKLGELAKERGVSVSIISIVSSDCNLEMLSPLADLTEGDIIKVNPINLSNDFATILSENIIATNVELRVKLHKGLTFRNEDQAHVSQDGSLLIRPIGNATDEQELTIEYKIKDSKELDKMTDVDFTKLDRIPFQTQISYINLEGMKCVRLVTKNQSITFEKEEAKKEADYKVISVNAVQQTAKLARKGKLRDAQANAMHWKNMMKGSEEYANYVGNSEPLYNAMQHQQQVMYMAQPVPSGFGGVGGVGGVGRVGGVPVQYHDDVVYNMNQATRMNQRKMAKK